ncbi:MAG TPA: hypothetical protein VD931_15015 [Baekduia sp.]|nr:hypothetical protein [Baekduia sp.]
MPSAARRLRGAPAWVLSAALAAAWLAWQPPVSDLAAQRFRTWLFEEEGFVTWNGLWYAGHHVPGYSILFPPLAALVGPALVGAASAVAFSAAFERLARDVFDDPGARLAAVWAAAGSATMLLTGRLTFALGAALACAAVVAARRGRPAAATALAALTSLASPVAALFLGVGALAWLLTERRGAALALGAGAVVPAGLVGVAFPQEGTFPFVASSALPAIGGALLVAAVLPARQRTLRLAAVLYAVLVVASAVVPTAFGGNAVRLGALLGGPLVAGALWPARRGVVLAAVPALLWWQWGSAVDDVVRATGDRYTRAATYRPLLAQLERRAPAGPFRVEVPFTDSHWESLHLGREVPLARGWLRQTDRAVNGLFYEDGPLDAARYRRWLNDNAVAFVALPLGALDHSAAREADLVRSQPAYLREVWRDADWRLFAVRDPAPAATGAARALALQVEGAELAASRAGTGLVRVRWTPYWQLDGGCVQRAGDWTRVTFPRPGRYRLRIAVAPGRVLAGERRCAEVPAAGR